MKIGEIVTLAKYLAFPLAKDWITKDHKVKSFFKNSRSAPPSGTARLLMPINH